MPSDALGRVLRISGPSLPDGAFLHSFRGRERLGRPFKFKILFSCPEGTPAQPQLLGSSVNATLHGLHGQRTFSGIVAQFSLVELGACTRRHMPGRTMYRAVVRPSLWRLTRSGHCRFFHDKTVPDIAETAAGRTRRAASRCMLLVLSEGGQLHPVSRDRLQFPASPVAARGHLLLFRAQATAPTRSFSPTIRSSMPLSRITEPFRSTALGPPTARTSRTEAIYDWKADRRARAGPQRDEFLRLRECRAQYQPGSQRQRRRQKRTATTPM